VALASYHFSDAQGSSCPQPTCRKPHRVRRDSCSISAISGRLGPGVGRAKSSNRSLAHACGGDGLQTLFFHAPSDERPVRLMKNYFFDDRAFAGKFDEESLLFDDAEPSAMLRREAIDRLIVGLQHKLAFRGAPPGQAATVENQAVTAIALASKAEAIMRFAELRIAR
jgi:hypothetical protein